jgi:PAS domain S-box-containing protein
MISFVLIALGFVVVAFCFMLIQNRKQRKTIEIMERELLLNRELLEVSKSEIDKKIENCREWELLARLVSQSPNAIMLMDVDGNIEWVNNGFSNMYEYSYTEFIRKLGSNYRQTSFNPNVQSRLDTIARTKQPFRYEALNVTKTGRSMWTQTALMPILNDEGAITNLVTIDTDIHQRVLKSDNVISEMEQLNDRIDHLSKQFRYLDDEFRNLFQNISELYLLIEKTDHILQFIREISDKTKILGFNASIEASRAGEHGRGFRVITNEIVDISNKTIFSISQIKEIVNSIKSKQSELNDRKDESENRIVSYQSEFDNLKKEVRNIENAIVEFKSLA